MIMTHNSINIWFFHIDIDGDDDGVQCALTSLFNF